MIYQFKITLKHMKPPVWRRIQVDSQTTFYVLHHLIQEAFDWEDAHLHEFDIKLKKSKEMVLFASDSIRIGATDDADHFGSELNEKEEIIEDHLKNEKDKMLYIYDFEDDWQHEILLENIMFPEENISYPRCLKVKGLAPEEDSFGFWEDEEPALPTVDEKTLIHDINQKFSTYATTPKRHDETIAKQKNWQELFQVINQYKALKPWQQFLDSQIIVIGLPNTEEKAYCSILGNGGEEFGLAVYLGNQGLINLHELLEDPSSYADEGVMTQRSLLFSLSDRDELEKEDYKLIKSLGLGFRGKKQWPIFRSYKPGYYPWYLDQEEVQILKIVLEQILIVANQFINSPRQIPAYHHDEWLMRIPSKTGEKVNWKNKMGKPLIQKVNQEPVGILLSEIEIKRIKKRFNLVNTINESRPMF